MPTRILHANGRYYYVHRYQVRTRRDDMPPGGRIRRNTMINDPMLTDVFNYYHDGYYTENYIDKDSILYDVTYKKPKYSHSTYQVDHGDGDTVFDGAFCVDNQIYLVVSVPQKTFIACLDNNRLTTVMDFGQHFEIEPSTLQISTLNQQNMKPDCSLLIYNAKYKYRSMGCGLIDIEGNTVKVIHFDFPSQNLGSYPPVHFRSTPN